MNNIHFDYGNLFVKLNVTVLIFQGSHPPIKDMFSDLRDGTKLLALLEVLTNKTYVIF